MLSIVTTLVLPLIEQLLPLFGTGVANSGTVGLVIRGLETAIPLLGKLATTWAPKIKNIVAVVSASPEATAEQLAKLRDLDAASDAAFDAAVAAAEAEDAKGA